jgi:transposase
MSAAPCGNTDFWVGVDLAQATFQAACAPLGLSTASWQRLPQASFANTAEGWRGLAQWIAQQHQRLGGTCRGIAVEATGGLSRRFVQSLAGLELPVPSILNPAFVKAFGQSLGQRSKNDKLDAAVLAVFGAVHQPAPAAELTPAQARIRELDRLRQSLVQQQTAWQNSRREAREALALELIEQQLQLLADQIKRLDQQIDQTIEQDPDLRRQRELLKSVPGIGDRVAATLLAELGDLAQYGRDELVSYVGLFPREFTSGASVRRRAHLVKGGGSRVRRMLAMAAMAIVRNRNAALVGFHQHLLEAGKSKMSALVALMRKLLLVARAVVKSAKRFDPAEATRGRQQKKVVAV